MPELRLTDIIGRPAASKNASDTLREAHTQLQEAERLRLMRKYDRARAICESLVERHPDYVGALHTLGLIYAATFNYPAALGCLVRAAMHNPRSWSTLTALSGVYLRLGAEEMAAQTLEQARQLKPGDPSILMMLGEIYREEREYELARDAFRQAVQLDRTLHPAAIGLSACYAHLGEYSEAAKVLEGLLKGGAHSLDVLAGFGLLPPSVINVDILARLEKVERAQDSEAEKANFETSVRFIRAAALDRLGRHREAWDDLVAANRTVFLPLQDEVRTLAESQREDLKTLQQRTLKARDAASETVSLFVFGPSRSGKTTLEELLGGLNGVKRGYENPMVANAVRRTFQSSGLLSGGRWEFLPRTLDSACRELYLEDLARRAGAAKVFTNTQPGRIVDAGRLAATLPNVRFILVKRNVEDTMLRIYMREYESRNAYAYDLNTIREHVLWYHDMIDVLAEKLPAVTRVIHYEDMVADPAAALRIAAELCGLPAPDRPLPKLDGDVGCAAPYREWMAAALNG